MTSNSSSLDNPPTIVVLGTTGAGKSSVINMLADDPRYPPRVAMAKNAVSGVTRVIEPYHKMAGDRAYTILDMPGTGEPATGTVPTHRAIGLLYNHLADRKSSTAVHLVVVVKKAGRITVLDDCNYLLARFIFGDEVPIILALTNLENEADKDKWWERNENKGKMGLLHAIGLVSFTGRNNVFKRVYDESKINLSRFIAAHSRTDAGYSLQHRNVVTEFLDKLKRMRDAKAAQLHKAMLQFLEAYEMGKKQASSLASKIRPTVPLPVIVFLGDAAASATSKTGIIDIFPDGTDTPSQDSIKGVRDNIKLVDNERIRTIGTPNIALPIEPDEPHLLPHQAIRVFYSSLIAHHIGIRFFVVVSQSTDGRLTDEDVSHYLLARCFCPDAPICLIIQKTSDNAFSDPLTPNNHLPFAKQLKIPRSEEGSWAQDTLTKDGVKGMFTPFLLDSSDHTVKSGLNLSDLLLAVSNAEIEINEAHSAVGDQDLGVKNIAFHRRLQALLLR